VPLDLAYKAGLAGHVPANREELVREACQAGRRWVDSKKVFCDNRPRILIKGKRGTRWNL